MFFSTTFTKSLRCTHILYRLCSSRKPPDHVESPTEPTDTLADARDPHCNPYLDEPKDLTIESYKDSKKYKKRILKKVLIEKEFDANARSRLTKECTHFINSTPKNLKASTGCSISFNQSGWQTYDFDQFQVQASGPDGLTLRDCPDKDKLPSPPGLTEPQIGTKALSDKTPPSKDKKGDGEGGGGGDSSKKGGDGEALGTGAALPPNRIVRREHPGKVIATFIPVEFLEFFFSKTGVSGFYTFLFTFGTYLVSKEIYVLDHSYYHGLGALFMWIGYIKYGGPPLAKYLDKEIDNFEQQWKDHRAANQKALEDEVVHELYSQFQADGQLILIQAKRENVALQLEEEFRNRQMQVYDEVLRILDYQVQAELVRNKIQQKNLVEYVTNEVKKAITPDLENRLIYYSIDSILAEVEKAEKNKDDKK